MDGEATPAQLAALLMGLRMRGETVEELAGFAAAMRERVVRVDAPAGAIDVVGHRRRRQRDVQHLDDGRARRGRGRCRRSRSTATGRSRRRPARPTCSTRSASGSTTTPRPRLGLAPRARLRVPLRPELPPGDEARRADAARDRRADGVQPARPADQPGRHDAPAPRRRRPGRGAADRRGGRAARHRADVRGPRRRRRRAAARRDRASSTTSRAAGSIGPRWTRCPLGLRPRPRLASRGARPRRTRRSSSRSCAASPACGGMSCC